MKLTILLLALWAGLAVLSLGLALAKASGKKAPRPTERDS